MRTCRRKAGAARRVPPLNWCFSLTKPLVLPGVNKKALANKIRFEVVDLIEKTENIELSESFLMGKKKCFEAVSREYATQSRQGFARLRVAGRMMQ